MGTLIISPRQTALDRKPAPDSYDARALVMEETPKTSKPETAKCRKLLLSLTLVSLAVGLLLLVAGAVVLAKYNIYLDFLTTKYTASASFILALGIWTMMVSACGFYAAFKTNYCLMTTFLAVMMVVVVMEVIAAVATFALASESSDKMARRHMLRETLAKYQEGVEDAHSRAWDLIQTELSCCGLRGARDYVTPVLPASCCGPLRIDTLGKVETCSTDTETLYKFGCETAFQNYLNRNAGILGGVAVLVAIFQVVVITSSTVLLKRWEKPQHCA